FVTFKSPIKKQLFYNEISSLVKQSNKTNFLRIKEILYGLCLMFEIIWIPCRFGFLSLSLSFATKIILDHLKNTIKTNEAIQIGLETFFHLPICGVSNDLDRSDKFSLCSFASSLSESKLELKRFRFGITPGMPLSSRICNAIDLRLANISQPKSPINILINLILLMIKIIIIIIVIIIIMIH
ncbi:hypothetical protein SSS_09507, partial [Sarcoptes scabiei]